MLVAFTYGELCCRTGLVGIALLKQLICDINSEVLYINFMAVYKTLVIVLGKTEYPYEYFHTSPKKYTLWVFSRSASIRRF